MKRNPFNWSLIEIALRKSVKTKPVYFLQQDSLNTVLQFISYYNKLTTISGRA